MKDSIAYTPAQQREERRPGITEILREIRQQNPQFEDWKVEHEAKLEWHRRNKETTK